MRKREEIKQLFERYRDGKCTPDEEKRLHAWFSQYVKGEARGLDELRDMYDSGLASGRSYLLRWLPYAAAVLLAVFAVSWLFFGRGSGTNTPSLAATEIMPGGNPSTLTLADGRTINLSDAQSGILMANERVLYENGSEELVDLKAEEIIPLVLSTPKGGTYQITLSDGTKVWLNAASSLKYPSQFSGTERIVELTGEGYFKVEKQLNKPFKVISKGQEIQVFGTEFNVNAYPDSKVSRTTLISGSVRVQSPQRSLMLTPGDQSIVNNTGELKKLRVDVAMAAAWKRGIFYFKETPFEEVSQQITRWYDIEVVYKSQIPSETFSGTMTQNMKLQTVLELLTGSGVRFHLEGNKLIVE